MSYLALGLREMDWIASLIPPVVCCITLGKFCWK
jgi:hypothetical protein